MLYVCATPIGNLDDVSHRLLAILREVDCICAEDTRHTGRLLARFDIKTPLLSAHQHSHPDKIAALAARLAEGESFALVTDAGTPGVCDPGPALVRAAIERGVEIQPIPGPCALVAALSISGFDAQKFSFLGFLPRKPGRHRRALQEALERNETVVFYESPHRVLKTLAVLNEIAPAHPIVASREITKKFEETLRGTAVELIKVLSPRKELLGEFVISIGATESEESDED